MYPMSVKRRSMVVSCLAVVLCSTGAIRGAPADGPQDLYTNIAHAARYVLSPTPDYPHCTDPGDMTQLTDGQMTEDHFWTQAGTVGWRMPKYVTITVDLGQVEPIRGVSFRTAAGAAGVYWPSSLRIHVSDDDKTYRDVGDLLRLDESPGALPQEYAIRRFATSKLSTRGRYVRFLIIPCGPYVFVDEVEVFRGPDSFLENDPGGEPAGEADAFFQKYRFEHAVHRRFRQDAHLLKEAINQAKLPATVKERLGERLADVAARLDDLDMTMPEGFRTVLPFNSTHGELFGVQAALWKETGYPALSASAAAQWDPLEAIEAVPLLTWEPIEVHTMLGEYRSAAFNLVSTGDAPRQVNVCFSGLPGSPTPDYITVHEVCWTDTESGKPVAAALPAASRVGDQWRVEVLPGLVQQVWLTFHVVDLPAGFHVGQVVIEAEGMDELTVLVRLHVYPLSFPARTTLWLGGWSYTDGQGNRGVTLENRDQLLEHLQSRFVNAPWATSQTMISCTFDKDDPSKVTLDTDRFDDWVKQWPNARTYLVFLAVGKTFAHTQIGTEAFHQRVGTWISAWVRHLKTKGIRPAQLGLLLVDEPSKHEQDDVIIPWARAIKAAEPEVLIWEDPIYHNPKDARPELFEVCDIICPNRPMWLQADKRFGDFYIEQGRKGRTLQLYSCSGPARLLDPYAYYRLQAWHCWDIGATGSFFWAFGDNGQASAWNEYIAGHRNYAPMFLDETSVTAAKQMEAIRESAEDYEYFVMLKERVERARANAETGPAVREAEHLLTSACTEVLGPHDVTNIMWHAPKDTTKADAVRVRLLKALTALQASP